MNAPVPLGLFVGVGVLFCIAAAGSARAQEPEPTLAAPGVAEVGERSAANLLLDLRKIVELQESTGWKIDRYEYEAMMPNALMSVCGASPVTRERAQARAREESARLGAPLERALAASSGSLEGLGPLLFALRVEGLLARASERAGEECPPWAIARDPFEPRQSASQRWLLTFEGGGQGTLQFELDRADGTSSATLGGGGGGRVLVGRAFGTWSLRFGPDISAKALVKRSGDTTTLPLQLQAGVPIVLRREWISWFSSVEGAPLLLAVEGDRTLRVGGRAGLLVGRSALRVRSLLPWAGLGVEVEVFPSPDERPTLLNVKGGLRAGIDWML